MKRSKLKLQAKAQAEKQAETNWNTLEVTVVESSHSKYSRYLSPNGKASIPVY